MTAKELFNKHSTKNITIHSATGDYYFPFMTEQQFIEALAEALYCGQVELIVIPHSKRANHCGEIDTDNFEAKD